MPPKDRCICGGAGFDGCAVDHDHRDFTQPARLRQALTIDADRPLGFSGRFITDRTRQQIQEVDGTRTDTSLPINSSAPVGEPDTSLLLRACELLLDALAEQHPDFAAVRPITKVSIGETHKGDAGEFRAHKVDGDGRKTQELVLNVGELGKHFSNGTTIATTLTHEACHSVALQRGVGDTSNGGRYHEDAFAHIAIEFGLCLVHDAVHGWMTPELADHSRHVYAKWIRLIDLAPHGVLDAVPTNPSERSTRHGRTFA